jgi:transcriptional regulator of acetoin/glycerol metabolism
VPPGRSPTTLRDISDQTIARAIAESRNNITHAARSLGVHRSTLYRYLHRCPRDS